MILNTLKKRLIWYEQSIALITRKIPWTNNYDFPPLLTLNTKGKKFSEWNEVQKNAIDTALAEWTAAAAELKNTISMLETNKY